MSELKDSRSAAHVTELLDQHERTCENLVRILHDDLGGLLIAASMDVAWLQRQGKELDAGARQVLERAREAVGSAITLKRKVIEDLRPTLLDNVGLFAALRWHLRRSSAASGLSFSEHFHDPEPALSDKASIALYRVTEDALKLLRSHANTRSVGLRITVDEHHLVLSITNDAPFSDDRHASDCDSHAYLTLAHRVRALRGNATIERARDGGWMIRAEVPLEAVLSLDIPSA